LHKFIKIKLFVCKQNFGSESILVANTMVTLLRK
jgi:hypothetical protein